MISNNETTEEKITAAAYPLTFPLEVEGWEDLGVSDTGPYAVRVAGGVWGVMHIHSSWYGEHVLDLVLHAADAAHTRQPIRYVGNDVKLPADLKKRVLRLCLADLMTAMCHRLTDAWYDDDSAEIERCCTLAGGYSPSLMEELVRDLSGGSGKAIHGEELPEFMASLTALWRDCAALWPDGDDEQRSV